MNNKKQARLRRARKARIHITAQKRVCLTVHRTNFHIYAQIIDTSCRRVLASASSLEATTLPRTNGGNIRAAVMVGERIAQKAKAAGIEKVAFDRSGFKYHGRVKALAEAAREHGLKF